MTNQRFWVVGGLFTCMAFDRLIEGTQEILGPFMSRMEAERAWRDVSEQRRSQANARYTIAVEGQAAA